MLQYVYQSNIHTFEYLNAFPLESKSPCINCSTVIFQLSTMSGAQLLVWLRKKDVSVIQHSGNSSPWMVLSGFTAPWVLGEKALANWRQTYCRKDLTNRHTGGIIRQNGGGGGHKKMRKRDLSWTANAFCRNGLLKAIGTISKVRYFSISPLFPPRIFSSSSSPHLQGGTLARLFPRSVSITLRPQLNGTHRTGIVTLNKSV